MKVWFITRRGDHKLNDNPLIEQRLPEDFDIHDLLLAKNGNATTLDPIYYHDWWVIGHDIENRGLFTDRKGLLLSAFCMNDKTGNEEVLVIDNTSVDNQELFTPEILRRCIFIAHNADHEARWGIATNFLPMRYMCTMVSGRRLLSGQEGFRFDLVSEINRQLGYEYIPAWMDKDIRSEFATCQYFEDYHILYNAADTIRLKLVHYKQREQAVAINQLFLHNISSRIIIPIAEAEERGIRHDMEKWISIAKERQAKAELICKELDELIVGKYQLTPGMINPVLRKKQESLQKKTIKSQERKIKLEEQLKRLEENNKTHLKSYQVTKDQLQKLYTTMEGLVEVVTGGINWGSAKQVLTVLREIGCPLPQAKDKRTHKLKDGLGKEARNNWFTNNTDSEFELIIKRFDEYKKLIHNVTSFGEKWIQQYVRNGRAYTSLDQAGTDTGRFSSGSKGLKKIFANLQQIPKPLEYRQCFIADPGRVILTADYNNCEGVIMIAQSGDLNMKKITELKDQHSYLGTKCYRNVYAYRYKITGDEKYKELAQSYEMSQSTPEKKKERDIFKNSGGLFPVAYGVFASKVAGAAKVSEQEGQIMIDTIKGEIPLVIKYLDEISHKAIREGYVVHNTRTGSRRWFQKVLDHNHYGAKLSKGDIIEVESAARNTAIQGTNSDLMKEAIAMLALWVKLYRQDIKFMLTVHDELVCDCPEDKAEFFREKLEKIMERAAKNYLIKEIDMKVDCKADVTWIK